MCGVECARVEAHCPNEGHNRSKSAQVLSHSNVDSVKNVQLNSEGTRRATKEPSNVATIGNTLCGEN